MEAAVDGARRKFVKVIVMVDVRRKLPSVEAGVQGEGPSEPEAAAPEVGRLHGRRATRLCGDSAAPWGSQRRLLGPPGALPDDTT